MRLAAYTEERARDRALKDTDKTYKRPCYVLFSCLLGCLLSYLFIYLFSYFLTRYEGGKKGIFILETFLYITFNYLQRQATRWGSLCAACRMGEIRRFYAARRPNQTWDGFDEDAINKVWTADDLHDTDHPELFAFALFLLYQKLRGVRTLYLGSSIHIRYSELSVRWRGIICGYWERRWKGQGIGVSFVFKWRSFLFFLYKFRYSPLFRVLLGYFIAYKYQNNFIFIFKSREPLKLSKSGDIWILK